MTWKIREKYKSLLKAETNLLRPGKGGELSICLISPGSYHTGMSSLGFQTVYSLFASSPGILCERAFMPDREELEEYRSSGTPLLSLESQRPLSDFDLLAFSISFEPDYLNIPRILNLARIAPFRRDRDDSAPLLIGGGAAFFINPEPVADFFDIICIGEGEEIIAPLVTLLLSKAGGGRAQFFESLSKLPGIYLPTDCDDNGLTGIDVNMEAAQPVQRATCNLREVTPASSRILTANTEFGDMFLLEVARGCPRGCRFCTSGFIYGQFRQHEWNDLIRTVDEGLASRNKIGLVGAAVSDHRDIGRLCSYIVERGGKVSVSSLRIDRLDPAMLDALTASGHRTISLAPEGSSQRLRDLIRKNLSEEQILDACELLASRDILNLKLYVIIGLPTETDEDLEELLRLVMAIRERVVERARLNGRLGEILLSVNPFIPKPFTPFQWCGMERPALLEHKVKLLEKRLRPVANVRLKVESLKESYLQALISRGDRRLSGVLSDMAEGMSLKKAAQKHQVDTDNLVFRDIGLYETLPWRGIGTADMEELRQDFLKAFPDGVVHR